jgi:hypothetical protein
MVLFHAEGESILPDDPGIGHPEDGRKGGIIAGTGPGGGGTTEANRENKGGRGSTGTQSNPVAKEVSKNQS